MQAGTSFMDYRARLWNARGRRAGLQPRELLRKRIVAESRLW